MVWKKVNNADAGDADHFGGNDLDKISDLFSGVDVDDLDFNADITVRKDKLKLSNTGNTFTTTLNSGEVTANRVIDLPTGGNTTLTGIDSTQTLTNKTINSANNTITGTSNADGQYLRANGTKYVSSSIQYYDMPRAVYTNTNDIFFRNRNSSNDTNPIASYSAPSGSGYSPHTGYLIAYNYNDDLTSDTFTDTNVTGVSGGVISFNSTQDGSTVKTCAKDFGSTVWDGANNTFRFRIRVTANTISGDGGAVFIGLSSTATGRSENQWFYGLQIRQDVGLVGTNQQYTVHTAYANGSQPIQLSGSNQNFTFNTNEWYYWQIDRTSGSMNVRCFGQDPYYSKQIGSTLNVGSLGNTATRYLKICNENNGANAGDRTYEIDEFRGFYTTNFSTLQSNIASPARARDGTINNTSYFLSETKERYAEPPQIIMGNYQIYLAEDWKRYQTQEQADYFWKPQDTIFRSSIIDDALQGTILQDGTNNNAICKFSDMHQVNTTPSATNWEITFKATFSGRIGTTTNKANCTVGIYNSDETVPQTVSQKFNGFYFSANNTDYYWGVGTNSAGGVMSGAFVAVTSFTSNSMTANTPYYFRLSRYGDTTMSYGIYKDDKYTQLVTQSTYSITATTQTTDMIYVGVKNDNNASTNDSAFNVKIENFAFVNATSSTFNPPITGNTTYNTITPYDPIAFALHLYKAKTTETQIKLRIGRSPSPFFTDADTVRTINISDFNEATYRYIPINKVISALEADAYGTYWWQIIGTTNTSDFAIQSCYRQVFDDTYNAAYVATLRHMKTHLHYLFKKTDIDNTFDAN